MASKWLLCLGTLAAFPISAQIGNGIAGGIGGPFPTLRFQPRLDPALQALGYRAGSSARGTPNFQFSHRFFYDLAARTYFGYDVVVQPGSQAGEYKVAFYDLSVGPLDFASDPRSIPDPTGWTKLPMRPLPPSQTMHEGDVVEVTVYTDPNTGNTAIDTMTIQAPRISQPSTPPTIILGGRGAGTIAAPPTVSGEPREFSVDDAEMNVQWAGLTFNGQSLTFTGTNRARGGSLIWIYVPNHGRYILSVSPRPALGFTRAGEIRGGVATFTLGPDTVRLSSVAPIAPGEGPYILYVLHDREWTPTAERQGGSPLLGSVSARELAALARK